MKKLIYGIIALAIVVAFTGCGKQPKPVVISKTGKVNVVIEKEVKDKKTGAISIEAQRLDEIAERSTVDKGAEALLAPQRYVNIGKNFFNSYSVGSNGQIITTIYNQDGKKGSDLWIFKNGKIRLTKTNYFNRYPSFSIDGKYVYFSATRGKRYSNVYDQNSYIWRMPSNGAGGLTRIGTPTYKFYNPVESPDGTKILFSSKEFYENSPFIWYMQKNGALPTQLKQGISATWMNDNKIVFSAKDENTGLFSIWTSNIDGSDLTQIISDNELDCIQPEVDPNGNFIAFTKQLPNKNSIITKQSRDIYIFNIKNNLSQQITTNISRDDMPHWSKQGDYIYFRSSRGLAWNIWRLSTKFLDNK